MVSTDSKLKVLKYSKLTWKHTDADYSQINTKACTSREISVSNAPTSGNAATADLTILLLLSLLRSLPSLLEGVSTLGHDTAGKTLGILGLGGVGRQVASRANAFGMKACYWNPEKLDTEHEEGFEYVELERLLAESDVLSLHLTLDVSFPCPFTIIDTQQLIYPDINTPYSLHRPIQSHEKGHGHNQHRPSRPHRSYSSPHRP